MFCGRFYHDLKDVRRSLYIYTHYDDFFFISVDLVLRCCVVGFDTVEPARHLLPNVAVKVVRVCVAWKLKRQTQRRMRETRLAICVRVLNAYNTIRAYM